MDCQKETLMGTHLGMNLEYPHWEIRKDYQMENLKEYLPMVTLMVILKVNLKEYLLKENH